MVSQIRHGLRSLFCCTNRTQTAQPVSNPISTEQVFRWLNRTERELSDLNQLNSNGLYSLLNKEVTVINNLLIESETLIADTNPTTTDFARRMIELMVRPKKTQLLRDLAAAQQTLAEHQSEIPTDEKIDKKWKNLELPDSVLKRHADCARFLIESELAFSIVGFRQTVNNPELHDLKLADDGHPLIKVQGEWVRWERLKEQVVYDPSTYMIRSRDYPGQVVQFWTYLSPQGLMPIDRLNHDHMIPIHRVSPEEYREILALARHFYETNPEVDQGVAKECVIQFATSPSRRLCASRTIDNVPKNKNLIANLNTHVVMRLIFPNGDLYSFGLEMPAESQEFLFGKAPMATVPARINKAGDYEEFREFEKRIVTGIPLTAARANGIIQMLNNMGDVRFQFMRQNCSNLMRTVLQEVGYQPINNRMTAIDVLWGSVPNLEHLPVLGPIVAKIQLVTTPIFKCIGKITPQCIKTISSYISTAIWFIPKRIAIFLVNVIQWYLGGSEMLYPLEPGVSEDEFYDNRRIIHFSRNIRSFWDLFKEETSIAYHSKQIIEWQKSQRSTFTEPYRGQPKLVILPSQATTR